MSPKAIWERRCNSKAKPSPRLAAVLTYQGPSHFIRHPAIASYVGLAVALCCFLLNKGWSWSLYLPARPCCMVAGRSFVSFLPSFCPKVSAVSIDEGSDAIRKTGVYLRFMQLLSMPCCCTI